MNFRIVLVVIGFAVGFIAVSLILNRGGDESDGGGDLEFKTPDYAERMGLPEVPRAVYDGCPFIETYEESVACLGVEGVEITRVEDLPPFPLKSTVRQWKKAIEAPNGRCFAWVNEYDEVMVTTYLDGKTASKYAGQPPGDGA